MAIVTLQGTPSQALRSVLLEENPRLGELSPSMLRLGLPKQQAGRRTSLQIIGDAGTAVQAQVSGNLIVFYNRVDMEQLTRGQKPLPVFGGTRIHSVLTAMSRYWGIQIDPQFVQDGELDTEADHVTLTFLDNQTLIMQPSVTFSMQWSDTVDIASMWRLTALDGLSLPWPYPQSLSSVYADTALSGLAMPELVYNMVEHSKRWEALATEDVAWLTTRTVGGAYAPADLVRVLAAASQGAMPWQCTETEKGAWNLWGSSIVYNGVAEGDLAKAYTHMLKIRPNSVYFHEGTGDISIYYTAE